MEDGFLNSLTRLTVGRVKPLLDLHRLSAGDAIMIPFKVWSGRQFPIDKILDEAEDNSPPTMSPQRLLKC